MGRLMDIEWLMEKLFIRKSIKEMDDCEDNCVEPRIGVTRPLRPYA